MGNLCIIPARGGSKRIPRKNIRDFLGKPIVAYSIEVALKSNLFDEVMVSTDDDEIASIAENHGAKVPFLRTKRNSDDYATTMDVLSEVLNLYRVQGKVFKYACCIYPTAPFVTEEKLKKAHTKLIESNFDCVFPVVKYSFPIQRALRMSKGTDKVSMFYPENMQARSQDLESSFHDAGQFYFFQVEAIINKNKLWTDNTGGIQISEIEGQDIDNYSDWKLAELKYRLLNNDSKENPF